MGPGCGSWTENSAQGLAWLLSYHISTEMLGPPCPPVNMGGLPARDVGGNHSIATLSPPHPAEGRWPGCESQAPCPPSQSMKVISSGCVQPLLWIGAQDPSHITPSLTQWARWSHCIVFQGPCSTASAPPRWHLAATLVTFADGALSFPALWLVYVVTECSVTIITYVASLPFMYI